MAREITVSMTPCEFSFGISMHVCYFIGCKSKLHAMVDKRRWRANTTVKT